MLLFRSEEHIKRWRQSRGIDPGETFSLEQCWELARAWYSDRLSPTYIRRSAEEAEAVFTSLGLTGDFWRLRP